MKTIYFVKVHMIGGKDAFNLMNIALVGKLREFICFIPLFFGETKQTAFV